MLAVVLALCCMACASLNDFLFKLASGQRNGGRGAFVSLVGLVSFCVMLLFPADWQNWKATLLWGVISGLFSLVSNLLLIEAMERQSAGICSTIFRLNLVVVALLACLTMGEQLTIRQMIGVACAAGAVLCFLSMDSLPGVSLHDARLGLFLVILACIICAFMGLAYNYAFQFAAANDQGVTQITCLLWLIGGALYGLWKDRPGTRLPDRSTIKLGVISGLLVAGIIYFMAKSLLYGKASVVSPIAQMSFLGTLLLSVVFLKEKITWRKALGMVGGLAAILLLCI